MVERKGRWIERQHWFVKLVVYALCGAAGIGIAMMWATILKI